MLYLAILRTLAFCSVHQKISIASAFSFLTPAREKLSVVSFSLRDNCTILLKKHFALNADNNHPKISTTNAADGFLCKRTLNIVRERISTADVVIDVKRGEKNKNVFYFNFLKYIKGFSRFHNREDFIFYFHVFPMFSMYFICIPTYHITYIQLYPRCDDAYLAHRIKNTMHTEWFRQPVRQTTYRRVIVCQPVFLVCGGGSTI